MPNCMRGIIGIRTNVAAEHSPTSIESCSPQPLRSNTAVQRIKVVTIIKRILKQYEQLSSCSSACGLE